MAVSWPSGVNTRILRSGTQWDEPVTIIEDETRSGKMRRRLYHSQSKRKFSVTMRFSVQEYDVFRNWFRISLKRGAEHFMFPKIDSTSKTETEYRFSADGFPKYSNESGKIINVSMEWEEV